jgi:hypothetical protein
MPFEIKLDKPNLRKIASLVCVLFAFIFVFKIGLQLPLLIRQIIFLLVITSAPIYLLHHRYRLSRYFIWLPALVAGLLFLFPADHPPANDQPHPAAVTLPRNANAVRVLATNVQQVQNTLLVFCAGVRRFFLMEQNAWAWALLLTTLGQVFGSFVKRLVMKKRWGSMFAPVVLLFYELPDRLAHYVALETVLVLGLAMGWGLALHLLAIPHSVDLAWLFGLGGLTPMIGMLWAAGLALFFLPWSKGAWMPAVGLTISFAVLWLFKHFFLNRCLQVSRPQTHTPLILAGFLIGLVFDGYAGSFYAVPLFFVCLLISFYIQEAWRMLHPHKFEQAEHTAQQRSSQS